MHGKPRGLGRGLTSPFTIDLMLSIKDGGEVRGRGAHRPFWGELSLWHG